MHSCRDTISLAANSPVVEAFFRETLGFLNIINDAIEIGNAADLVLSGEIREGLSDGFEILISGLTPGALAAVFGAIGSAIGTPVAGAALSLSVFLSTLVLELGAAELRGNFADALSDIVIELVGAGITAAVAVENEIIEFAELISDRFDAGVAALDTLIRDISDNNNNNVIGTVISGIAGTPAGILNFPSGSFNPDDFFFIGSNSISPDGTFNNGDFF